MKHLCFLFLCLISSSLAIGQVVPEPAKVKPVQQRWAYDAFSYADFGTGEVHAYFSILYKMNPQLHAELRGFYDSYRVSDITDFSIRTKWYPTEKIYLFTGIGVQIQRFKMGPQLPIMPIRMLNGVGYEAGKNISVEAVYDLNLDAKIFTPNTLTLQGKYRF